ncbi:hypothetical protein KQX54_011429 [Cotesia glomerata]|uniref:Uncharacterized protein n=1 Tax=Cotesia glomerata TaxID=32391 RepID=A0AAV7J6M3_COTGL|nr:hypothetical protein KQX54_011429 [Cotesia glomerata]
MAQRIRFGKEFDGRRKAQENNNATLRFHPRSMHGVVSVQYDEKLRTDPSITINFQNIGETNEIKDFGRLL